MTIGVLIDGPWTASERYRLAFRDEILELTRGEFDVDFPDDKRIVGDWSRASIEEGARRLLADDEVDLVLGVGVIASQVLAEQEALPKPVIAPLVIDARMQGLPRERGTSGRENLNYVSLPVNIERDLDELSRLVDYEKLAVVASEAIVEGLPGIEDTVRAAIEERGKQMLPLFVRDDIGPALGGIPEEADAVLVVPLVQIDAAGFARLVEAINARGLPSFSTFGRSHVEAGILAASAPPEDLERLARRVALNVQSILLGEPAAELPVAFSVGRRLVLNMRTAREIGYRPSWDIISDAELINEEPELAIEPTSLREVAEEALRANLSLAAERLAFEASRGEVESARAARRPRAELAASARQIDEERAENPVSQFGETSAVAELGASQLLYSDRANARVTIEKRLLERRAEELEATRLDIVLDASLAYLDLLRAETLERIERDNLELTRRNLELAELRVEVGAAGRADVLRWEAEIANARRALIAAEGRADQARYALNRLLHRPLEAPLEPVDLDLRNAGLIIDRPVVERYIDDPWAFAAFRAFMVEEAMEIAPEIDALEAAIAAAERRVSAARRSFWAPDISLDASVQHVLEQGKDETTTPGLPLPGDFIEYPDTSWSVALGARLPLLTGGERAAELHAAKKERDALGERLASAEEAVDLRVRSAVREAGIFYPAIELSRKAAEAARENYELVADAYSKGALSVIDLIDAQNAAFVAEQSAATVLYDFIGANLQVQRAVGRFDFFLDAGEKAALLERMERFYQEAGVELD